MVRPLTRIGSLCIAAITAALATASPAAAQTLDPHPCWAFRLFNSCTEADGPWVTTPPNHNNGWQLVCPDGLLAVGSDAVFKGPITPLGTQVGAGASPGANGFWFEGWPVPFTVIYKPSVGCSPAGARVASLPRAAEGPRPYRRRVRTVRVRPRAVVRVRLGCARGGRLVRSGSAVGFYTRRPPSRRVVRALEHRHRRSGSVTRTIVAAPAGVGDDERVELKASVLCTRARELAGAAQDQNLEPCLSFTDCTPVEGPWVTTPQNGSNLQDVQCPSGLRAEGTDVVFSNSNGMDLVGTQTGGGLGPGMGRVLTFGAFGGQPTVVYKPAVGCLRSGATVFAARRGAPRPRPYRRRVRTVRIRPGRVVRVGLRCARGRRLVHSGSSVGFYTRRPPSPHIVRALKHRHRRSGPATRTVVSAPAGVGDDERVELQVSVTCSPAR